MNERKIVDAFQNYRNDETLSTMCSIIYQRIEAYSLQVRLVPNCYRTLMRLCGSTKQKAVFQGGGDQTL